MTSLSPLLSWRVSFHLQVKGAIIDETQEPAKDALIDAVEPDATDAPGFEEISHGANGHAPIAVSVSANV